MNAATIRDDHVLILSRQVLEATDIAEFAAARALGKIVVEHDMSRARDLLGQHRFSYAFIGLPGSDDQHGLLDTLKNVRTHIVLIGADPETTGFTGPIRIVARPFTEYDLEQAIDAPRA